MTLSVMALWVAINPPAERLGSGPAILVGGGPGFGGLGARGVYYLRLPRPRLLLAPWVSGGVTVPSDAMAPGWAAGTSLLYGHRHRAVLTASCGTSTATTLSLHGTPVVTRGRLDATVGLGYEYLARTAFILRLEPSLTVPIGGVSVRGLPPFVTLSAGIGWKAW
jgi:hypothetical protein